MDPQILLFNNFFIKNESHGTIYIFKNYFTIVFLILIFNFSKNKPNLNEDKHNFFPILFPYYFFYSNKWFRLNKLIGGRRYNQK